MSAKGQRPVLYGFAAIQSCYFVYYLPVTTNRRVSTNAHIRKMAKSLNFDTHNECGPGDISQSCLLMLR